MSRKSPYAITQAELLKLIDETAHPIFIRKVPTVIPFHTMANLKSILELSLKLELLKPERQLPFHNTDNKENE